MLLASLLYPQSVSLVSSNALAFPSPATCTSPSLPRRDPQSKWRDLWAATFPQINGQRSIAIMQKMNLYSLELNWTNDIIKSPLEIYAKESKESCSNVICCLYSQRQESYYSLSKGILENSFLYEQGKRASRLLFPLHYLTFGSHTHIRGGSIPLLLTCLTSPWNVWDPPKERNQVCPQPSKVTVGKL